MKNLLAILALSTVAFAAPSCPGGAEPIEGTIS